ncbi:hypothetical protein OBBRIDRAFT_839319 [Obba rivulosa]|uniref:Uncharacterized protein n=1 Tax=Obba rivulosa TaxID=1052685 RepID=A0A8E2AIU5_9APHY|nr:hypothetical protein OBBRIDRAFT_839319 [Obba rivulosa]
MQRDAPQDTPPAASARARKTRKRARGTITPLTGPSTRTADDFDVAEEQAGRNDRSKGAVRSTRSKARLSTTAATASRTRALSGNAQPIEPVQAKPPTDADEPTRSRTASSGRAFLAYDLWCAGLHRKVVGPAKPKESWNKLLQASYKSWNEIHARKVFYGAELDSRSIHAVSLPHLGHLARFDNVAAYGPTV